MNKQMEKILKSVAYNAFMNVEVASYTAIFMPNDHDNVIKMQHDKIIVIIPSFRHMYAGETFPLGYEYMGVQMLVYDDFYDFKGDYANEEERNKYLEKFHSKFYFEEIKTSHGTRTIKLVYYWRDFDKKEDELNEAM